VRQTVATFSPATVPYNVLLLFDWSASTLDKRSFLQQAAAGFVTSSDPRIGSASGDSQAVSRWKGGPAPVYRHRVECLN
jgi:hypothetical protein